MANIYSGIPDNFKKMLSRNSLVDQCLGLHAFTFRDRVWTLVQEVRSHKLAQNKNKQKDAYQENDLQRQLTYMQFCFRE